MNSTKIIKNTTAHRVKPPKHPPSYTNYTPFSLDDSSYDDVSPVEAAIATDGLS